MAVSKFQLPARYSQSIIRYMVYEGGKERRKYERFPFREDILIDGTRTCTSMDISEGGLYLSTIQSYEDNSTIEVTIPFKGEKLTVKAQVRYCQPGIGMGAMFVDLSSEQRGKIRQLIESISGKPVPSEREEKKILLVEDNNTARQAIRNGLEKEGFSVVEAMDGIEAMKFIAEQNLDLIILDLYMKGIDGLKVLSVLKTNPKWKDLPVIVCSGHDTQEVKDKVLNAGADEFLSKRGTSPSKLAQSARALMLKRHKA
jgi:two-component system, chemotaxis family, chemotaxis protein CheY